MMVQWIAPAAADGISIGFTEAGETTLWRSIATKQHPYPMTDLHVFRAELTGLRPGTEYLFQIGGNPTTHKFRTMPAKATDTFQFVSGGDCGVNEHAVANNIMAAAQEPMFALIGGDLGYDNGRSADTSLEFLRNYSRHMIDPEGRLIPMVVCIGNHEVNGSYGKTREAAPFYLALHDGLYAERTFATLDFGDYLSLVLLDTGHIAPIDGEQTAWLDKALAERTERPHLIAVNHVPAYPSYRPYESEGDKVGTGALNREHWCPLFERHNVDVVLEHHDHTFKRTHPAERRPGECQRHRLPGRRVVGQAACAEVAGGTPLPGDHERVVSHDVAPPGGRAAVPRRDRGDRPHRRHLHDAEAPASRRRPERLIDIRQDQGRGGTVR